MKQGKGLLAEFVRELDEEDPKLGKALAKLDADTSAVLEKILLRFDCDKGGTLESDECALASRVLGRVHRPSLKGMTALLGVLNYLDLNENQVLDHQELTLAVEILDLFCKADSVNDTLSVKELDMLLAVLKHIDRDGKGVLDAAGRNQLRDNLWDPDTFLAEQKQTNPHLRKVLGLA